jgi:transposase InsO family protein
VLPTCSVARGFVFLSAVLDWHSRRILPRRLSITMDADFCIEALQEAIARHGEPDIATTDQGSQFTGAEFIGELRAHGIAVSMDGRGQWRDNVNARATMEEREVRGRVPQGLRDGQLGPCGDLTRHRLCQAMLTHEYA